MLSFTSFIVLPLTFRSMIALELTFVLCVVGVQLNFFLHAEIQLYQHHF